MIWRRKSGEDPRVISPPIPLTALSWAGIVHLDEISSRAGTLPAKKSTTIKYAACTFKNTFYASACLIMVPFTSKKKGFYLT